MELYHTKRACIVSTTKFDTSKCIHTLLTVVFYFIYLLRMNAHFNIRPLIIYVLLNLF